MKNVEIQQAEQTVLRTVIPLLVMAVALSTIPALAVRHGIPAVWSVIPMVLLEALAMVYTVIALFELQQVKKLHDTK